MNTVLPVFSSNRNSWETLRLVEFCIKNVRRKSGTMVHGFRCISPTAPAVYLFTRPRVLPYKITSRCGARTTPDEDNGIWPLLSAFLCHHFYLTWFSDPLPTAPSVLPLANIYRLYIPSSNWIISFYRWIVISLNPVCFFGNFFLFSCL